VSLPIDKLKQLVALDPHDPALFLALGQAYLEVSQFVEAVTALERAVVKPEIHRGLLAPWEGAGGQAAWPTRWPCINKVLWW
jgi:hypothetical protein